MCCIRQFPAQENWFLINSWSLAKPLTTVRVEGKIRSEMTTKSIEFFVQKNKYSFVTTFFELYLVENILEISLNDTRITRVLSAIYIYIYNSNGQTSMISVDQRGGRLNCVPRKGIYPFSHLDSIIQPTADRDAKGICTREHIP